MAGPKSMADLKSAITRVQAALERAEALRPDLPPEAVEGLDDLKGNAELMRAEMDELLAALPPSMSVDEARGTPEQEKLDDSTAMMTRVAELLEAWLEEWGA